MRTPAFLLIAFLCASCSLTDVNNDEVLPASSSAPQGFIGEWTRGQPSADGYYSERFVVTGNTAQLFEDGRLVLSGSTVVKGEKLIIHAQINKSRYYRELGGCWARLRNNGRSLDLFGEAKGLLTFDRKSAESCGR